MPSLPREVLAGNVYVITQGSGDPSVNAVLVAELRGQSWATFVSPEILAFGTIRGEPVLVRTGDPEAVTEIDGGRWLQRANVTDRWAFAGEGLAARAGLGLGDSVSLVGSTTPRLAITSVTGLFVSDTAANEELIVDDATGRFLAGVPSGVYHSIRVKTSNPRSFLAFLEESGASVHVYGPGILRADVNSDPPSDERLTNLLLRYGAGTISEDYISTILSEGTNSVRIVVLGLGGFVGLLVALGVHAVQARAYADRRSVIGVLRAVGAGNRWLRARALRETLPIALVAGIVGGTLGGLLVVVAQPFVSVLLFGHEVRAAFDAITVLIVVAAVVVSSVVSASRLLGQDLRAKPMELIREVPSQEAPQSLEAVLRG